MKVREILTNKKNKIPEIRQNESVHAAIRKMLEVKESGLLILGSQQNLQGIITEKDVMRLLAERYTQLEKVEVWEVMSKSLVTIDAEEKVDAALAFMNEKHIHHLPVLENKKVIGMVSLDDLISARLSKTEREAQMLKDFISQQ